MLLGLAEGGISYIGQQIRAAFGRVPAGQNLVPERSEGLLFHRALDSHLSPPQKFHLKEGKTARYSGHCHRNLPLESCLVMRGSVKSESRSPTIEFEKS